MAEYTCGTIFYREGQILLCHATNQKHWDLPKGKAEKGETYAEAAARECREETGYAVNVNDLRFIAEVPYVRGKRLVLFYSLSRKPEIEELYCDSTFINHRGIETKECDEYRYVPVEDIALYCTKRMCNSIRNAIGIFFKENNKDVQ